MENYRIKNSTIIVIVSFLLAFLALITVPYALLDATDVKDYADTAKFFAGEYKASLRTTHSVVYGLMLSPYAKANSYLLIRFSSVFWLILIILSLYWISGKDRRVLLLFVISPFIWHMAPWISPVPAVSLLLLWTYYFLSKFEKNGENVNLVYAGLLNGVAATLWDTSLYFSLIFLISFLYNKKLYLSFIFLTSVFVGIIPKLIVDQIVFGFPFYGFIKFTAALLAFAFFGGNYGQGYSSPSLIRYIIVLVFVPLYYYKFYRKEYFVRYKKEIIFLTLSILFILTNPQIRLLLTIAPIILLIVGKNLTEKEFRISLIVSAILTLITITPYLIQSQYETNNRYADSFIADFSNTEINKTVSWKIIIEDLKSIEKDYPNEIFVVGNANDDYRVLGHLYWGDGINEFVSIEDYRLFLSNETTIVSKKFSTNVGKDIRRDIWIKAGIDKSKNDDTNYKDIKYGISFEDNLDIPEFSEEKKYGKLTVFKKE